MTNEIIIAIGFYIIAIIIYLVIRLIFGEKIKEYYDKQNRMYYESINFENHIKEYKNFMKATGKNRLKDIALEFNEDIFLVEKNIRRAIRIELLKGYYLCNQTGEILPINSNPFFQRKSITVKESRSIKIKE